MTLDLATRATGGYPADLRNGAGIKVTKVGLRADISLDLSQTQKLDSAPAGGLVPVQDPVTGRIQALDFSQLPTSNPADGSVANAKLTAVPSLTVKGNTTNANAQPQDVPLSALASVGNPIGDAIDGRLQRTGGTVTKGLGTGVVVFDPKAFADPIGGDGAILRVGHVYAPGSVVAGSNVSSLGRFEAQVKNTDGFVFTLLGIADFNGDTTKPGGNGQHVGVTGSGIRRTAHPTSNPEIWGAVFTATDLTGLGTGNTGAMLGVEVDVSVDGPDAINGRQGVGIFATRRGLFAGAAEVARGLTISSGDAAGGDNVWYKQGIHLAGKFSEACLDTRESVPLTGAHDIWLADLHEIALNTAGTIRVRFNNTNGRVEIMFKNGASDTPIWSTDTTATVRANRVINGVGATHWGSFAVAALPTTTTAPELKEGDMAYASNGRKVGQAAGTGTGVPVYYQGTLWHRYYDDATVTA